MVSAVDQIIEFENGELENDDAVRMFQQMVNDGTAWTFQGSYGRTAMAMIEAGQVALGKVEHRDAYGNHVPSRTQVKAGTKGSVEFVLAHGNEVQE